MKKIFFILFLLVLCACAHQYSMPNFLEYKPVQSDNFSLATWQKITDKNKPIHIYIEGDGHSFYANGTPTADPTPHDSFMRQMAAGDNSPNVVYIARPCQFINDSHCDVTLWTNARFSKKNIDSVAYAIEKIAGNRKVILIGYSGGAMVTGLIIENYKNIKVQKWITIAGILNHHDWTNYFGDTDLDKSLDLDTLPNIKQIHYVGDKDSVVPIALSKKWVMPNNLKIIHNATHDNFPGLKLDFQ